MVATGEFSRGGVPETFRTPGYPLLLVPGILLGSIEGVTIALQVLLGCVTIYLVYRIALLLFELKGPALCAAALCTVEPLSVIWTCVLHTETLFTTMLTSFLFFFLRYLAHGSWHNLVVSALFSAGAAYVRPVAYFIPLFVSLFLIVNFLLKRAWNRRVFFQIMAYFFIGYGALFAWQMRNAYQTGYWGFAGGLEDNLYYYTATSILAQVHNIPREEQRKQMFYLKDEIYASQLLEQLQWPEVEIRRRLGREAFKVIVAHPWELFKLTATSTVWTLGGPGLGTWLEVFGTGWNNTERLSRNRDITTPVPVPTEDEKFSFLRRSNWTLAGSLLLATVLGSYWIFSLVGVLNGYVQAREAVIFLVFIAAYMVLIPALQGIGYSRFRLPIMPILCVFGGGGIWAILGRTGEFFTDFRKETRLVTSDPIDQRRTSLPYPRSQNDLSPMRREQFHFDSPRFKRRADIF